MSGYGAGGYGDPAGGAAGPTPTGRPAQGGSPNPQGYPYAVPRAGSPYGPPVPPQGHPYGPYDQSPYASGPHGPVAYDPYAPYAPPPVEPSRGRRILRAVLNPLYAAQRTFRPSRTGIAHDPQVRRLQLWRTVLGLAAWVGLTLTYKAVVGADEVKALADDRLDQSWSSVLVLVCTFPVVVGGFVAAARGGLRRVYLRRALRPLGAVTAVMASMGTSALAMAPELAGLRDAVGLPGKIVIAVLCLWSIGFALYGIGLSLVHVFRTADIHEVVPPVLAGVLVWEMALLDLVTGAYPQVPAGVRAVFVLGAPVTVTALSWWELRRLRRHHGLTVRGALGR
ncbi:proline-rich domain-containing protein [Streptomyces lavendulae]